METQATPRFNAQKLQGMLFWAIIASESSHVFCCVIPTLISLFSLIAGLGLVSLMPASLLTFHAVMHRWEVPMIAASFGVLVFGWAAHWYSARLDCHSTGCQHGACEPKKRNAAGVLKIASLMFVVNVTIWYFFHHRLALPLR